MKLVNDRKLVLSVRLSESEMKILKKRAGANSVSDYVRVLLNLPEPKKVPGNFGRRGRK